MKTRTNIYAFESKLCILWLLPGKYRVSFVFAQKATPRTVISRRHIISLLPDFPGQALPPAFTKLLLIYNS
jgi:hypothetical protein